MAVDEGALLEQPEEVIDAEVVEETEGEEKPREVPSVFSVVNRYLIGAVDVSPPNEEDDSRIVRLHSAQGGAVIEANLSPELCVFLSGKLVEVEVIAEAEDDEDARASQ